MSARQEMFPRGDSRDEREEGSVTAELALSMPVIVLMLVTLLGVAAVGTASLEAAEVARLVARETARGTDPARVEELVRQASTRAAYTAEERGDLVHVRVVTRVGGVGLVPGIEVTGDAAARREHTGAGSAHEGAEDE
jgi:hypothetical protein